ncbi:hypothetical protein H6F86_07155 [Phormidium sp. FACHB-592]|uniref:Uncharacterized protein n=1 Tax=Stenomitos frigidus AS-A4 TaxID=2933935 RepID=A0ABV0KTB5_9CYAN|nr:hypothetical protein [Phormidium sp. FACHB-592]MBD2073672.1 hypothetical protein [Phormidium sp. FACHB-592]
MNLPAPQFQAIQEPDAFLQLFPQQFDFIYAEHPDPGERPDWKTEDRHPLSDRGVKPTYGQKGASKNFTCPSFDHWTAFGLNAPTGTGLKGRFFRCEAPLEPSCCRCPAAVQAIVLL